MREKVKLFFVDISEKLCFAKWFKFLIGFIFYYIYFLEQFANVDDDGWLLSIFIRINRCNFLFKILKSEYIIFKILWIFHKFQINKYILWIVKYLLSCFAHADIFSWHFDVKAFLYQTATYNWFIFFAWMVSSYGTCSMYISVLSWCWNAETNENRFLLFMEFYSIKWIEKFSF